MTRFNKRVIILATTLMLCLTLTIAIKHIIMVSSAYGYSPESKSPEEDNEPIVITVLDTSFTELEPEPVLPPDEIDDIFVILPTNTIELYDEPVLPPEDIPTMTKEERDSIIQHKRETIKTKDKTLSLSDTTIVDPIYGEDNKLIIETRAEAACLDIRTKSNWTVDDFKSILNKEMQNMATVAVDMENEIGINAVYLVAVAANETGWGKHMAAKNNYYNWSNDGVKSFRFETLDKFTEFSINTYSKSYITESDYIYRLGFEPYGIIPEVVNVKHALNADKSVNWQWSLVVTDIMSSLSARRLSK